MRPCLVLKTSRLGTRRGVVDLKAQAKKIADSLARKLGCEVDVVTSPRVSNPTLVAHGLVKASRWHLLTHEPPRKPIADLYAESKPMALRVARLMAHLLGEDVDLLDNRATPADLKAHPKTVVSGAAEFAMNPSRSPAARAARKVQRLLRGASRLIRRSGGSRRGKAMASRNRRLTARGFHGAPRANPKGRYAGLPSPKRGQVWTDREGAPYQVMKCEAGIVTLKAPTGITFPIFESEMTRARGWTKRGISKATPNPSRSAKARKLRAARRGKSWGKPRRAAQAEHAAARGGSMARFRYAMRSSGERARARYTPVIERMRHVPNPKRRNPRFKPGMIDAGTETPTFQLNDGRIVVAWSGKDWPKHYGNRAAAEKALAKLPDRHLFEISARPLERGVYIMLTGSAGRGRTANPKGRKSARVDMAHVVRGFDADRQYLVRDSEGDETWSSTPGPAMPWPMAMAISSMVRGTHVEVVDTGPDWRDDPDNFPHGRRRNPADELPKRGHLYRKPGIAGSPSTIVKVVGSRMITVGSGSEKFPHRQERWMEVRFIRNEEMSGVLLMHPNNFDGSEDLGRDPVKKRKLESYARGRRRNPSRSRTARARRKAYKKHEGGSRRTHRAAMAKLRTRVGLPAFMGSRAKLLYYQRESAARRRAWKASGRARSTNRTRNPVGRKTAKGYAGDLVANANAYHHGLIDKAEHSRRNAVTWGHVEKAGPRIKSAVLKLLRDRPEWMREMDRLADRAAEIRGRRGNPKGRNVTAYFNRFSLTMPRGAAEDMSGPGRADDAVQYWAPKITRPKAITKEALRAELKEYGAWDDALLADDAENWERLVWLAAGQIREENPRRSGNPKRRVPASKTRSRSPVLRRAARGRNPSSAEEEAARVVRMFQDRGPIKVKTKKMKRPASPGRAVAAIGPLVAVAYESNKFDGKKKVYEHEFSTPRPVLATGANGKGLFIVGGRFGITADGIVN